MKIVRLLRWAAPASRRGGRVNLHPRGRPPGSAR
jgi:hypothetical protein